MKKNVIVCSLAILGLLTASSFIILNENNNVYNQVAAEEEDFTDGEWKTAKGGATVFVDKGGYFEGGSSSWMSNFYVKQFDEAIGDYSVTIKMQGTMGFPNNRQVQFGVVPWYLDDNNYLVAFTEWSNETRLNGMYNFNLTGRIDGGMPYRFDGAGYTAKEWDDIWMDFGNEQYAQPANQENTITITKTRSSDGKYDVFTFYFNGNQLDNGVKYVRDTIKYSGRKAYCGFYAFNDTFKITEFSVDQSENNSYYHGFENNIATAKGNWSISGDNMFVSEEGCSNPEEVMLIDNKDISEGSYGVQFSPNVISHAANYAFGAIPWYQDEYNYLGVLMEKTAGKTNVRFFGRTIKECEKRLSFNTINEVKPTKISIEDIEIFKVEKRGLRIKLLVNGESIAEYENNIVISSQLTGLLAYGCNISFNNYEKMNELPYNPYDWYSTTLHNKTTYISAATNDEGAITNSRNQYIISDDAVTSGEKDKYTSLYFNSGVYAQMSMIMRIDSQVTEDSVFGAYPWLEDATSYLRIIVNNQGVIVESTFGGTNNKNNYNLPTGYVFTSKEGEYQLLKINIDYNDSITISLGTRNSDDNEQWFDVIDENDNFKILGRNKDVSPNIGFVCANKGMKCRFEAANGFNPYQPLKTENWELFGAMPDTWTYVDEDTFICNQHNGTEYMNAKALKPASEKADFFMGATITITNPTNAEHKAAFYPWYKDGDNYIIVMLSKWATNNQPSIVFTGKINGQVLGGREWHDYATTYQYEGKANKFEVEISGDHIKAYLNGATTPTQQVTFPGISNRDLNGAKSGFFFYNCDVMFDDYNICSDTRVYTSTEKPVIVYMGSLIQTGVINQQVSLPVFYAENSSGDILDVAIEITGPNGENIELTKMKFTPSVVGNYHVKVTCIDNWGNEADPFEYDIAVTDNNEGGSSNNGSNNDKENNKKGCGGSLASISMCLSVVLTAGLCLIFRKRGRND